MNKAEFKTDKIFIISGPSGAGEDSVIKGLKNYFEISRIITTITRKQRSNESQGDPYYFISKEKFEKGINEDKFIEYADVYGNLYGTTYDELYRVQNECETSNKIGIWKIDWQGVQIIKNKKIKIVTIMIEPPSLEELENRLIKRGEDDMQTIKKRVSAANMWLKHKNIFDYRVVNETGKLDQTVQDVANIINKHL